MKDLHKNYVENCLNEFSLWPDGLMAEMPIESPVKAYLLNWLNINREAVRDENDECIADMFINYITEK